MFFDPSEPRQANKFFIYPFQTLYDAWFISFYNVLFTSAPVVFLACLDQVRTVWDFCVSMVLRKGAPSSVIRKRLYMNRVLIDSSNLFVFDTSGQTKTLQLNNISQCCEEYWICEVYVEWENDLGGKKKGLFWREKAFFCKILLYLANMEEKHNITRSFGCVCSYSYFKLSHVKVMLSSFFISGCFRDELQELPSTLHTWPNKSVI